MRTHLLNRYLIPGLVGLTLGTTACGPTAEDFSQQSEPILGATGAAAQGLDTINGGDTGGFGAPFAVSRSSNGPVAVVATPETVVWAESDRVQLCPAAGCGANPPIRVTGSPLAEAPLPDTLAVDGTHAYWLAAGPEGAHAQRCPFTQCPDAPETFLDAFSGPQFTGLVIADGTAYAYNQWGAYGCPVSGCDRKGTRLFGVYDSWMFSMAADATGLYMNTDGEAHGTFYCEFGGCPPAKLQPLVSTVGEIATSNGNVYILKAGTSGNIETCPAAGCAGSPTVLVTEQSNVSAMAADPSGVYWAVGGDDGSVFHCALPRCAGGPVVVASGQANPVSLSVNDGYVYWANAGGSLMAAKKL